MDTSADSPGEWSILKILFKRFASRDTIEAALPRQRDLDHRWEDPADVSFVGSVF